MSADLLREAAALMRERAEAASAWDGLPWFAVDGSVYGGTAAPHQVVAPVTTYDGDAEHIASWHPAVALAVADWLEDVAAAHDDPYYRENRDDLMAPALNVARAYLGESS